MAFPNEDASKTKKKKIPNIRSCINVLFNLCIVTQCPKIHWLETTIFFFFHDSVCWLNGSAALAWARLGGYLCQAGLLGLSSDYGRLFPFVFSFCRRLAQASSQDGIRAPAKRKGQT